MESPRIELPAYLDRLVGELHTPDVTVLIGVRRCGRYSIPRLFADKLKADEVRAVLPRLVECLPNGSPIPVLSVSNSHSAPAEGGQSRIPTPLC